MTGLRRNLGLIETVGLSLSSIAPTLAMAFNVSLTAQVAGAAAPLTFLIGTVVIAVVALSFIVFTRRMANAGAAYAYVGATFGRRAGFLAGWLMLLGYACFAAGSAAMIGDFVHAAAADFGYPIPWLSRLFNVLGLLVAIGLVYRDMRLAARLMLVFEAASVAAIIALSGIVIAHAPPVGAVPFTPAPTFGWTGIGYGVVFAFLSFAGFEASAVLGEESSNPRRNIPIALMSTVLFGGAFFVIASYAQVAGFGPAHMGDLAKAAAPLNTLAVRFVSRDFAVVIDVAAAISSFSACLAATSVAARFLFALGRGGLNERLGRVDPVRGTPVAATTVVGSVCVASLFLWSAFVGGTVFYGYVGTIGTLALVVVYMGVTLAAARVSFGEKKLVWGLASSLGTVLLAWPLYNTLIPVPSFPNNLWPYVVLAWLVAGFIVLFTQPAVAHADLDAAAPAKAH